MRNKKIRAMKLWSGRFTKETNQLIHNLNESLFFDQKSYRQGIRGSTIHVKMLAKQGILTGQDRNDIIRGLESTLEDLDNGKLTISSDSGYGDIHSFVEGTLTKWIREAGKRLHTGHNRSDQVALGVKLYTRDEIDTIEALVKELLEGLLAVMEKNTDTFMSGFAHLQRAQPTTLAHRMGAYFEMLSRGHSRLGDIRGRINCCSLGSDALTGTTYPLDRGCTAELLEFDGPTLSSVDSVADRDYLIELLSVLSTISMHLSGFCEEIIIWNISKCRFVEIDDSYSTGSSTMPQKKSPGIVELIHGKGGRVCGALVSVLTTMRGIPLAYNKGMQKDKELTFDAINTIEGCLALFTDIISSMGFQKEVMEASAKNGFTNVTDAADYLVNRGIPSRNAHGIMEQLVLACINKEIALDGLSLKEYRAVSSVFEEDVYEAISMKTCVEKRLTIGTPRREAMKGVVGIYKRQLGVDDAQQYNMRLYLT